MPATTESLHEIAEQLATSERIRLDAVVDQGGAMREAVAVTVEPTLEADDPLAIFESTFGMGAELWATAEGREQLEKMRGSS